MASWFAKCFSSRSIYGEQRRESQGLVTELNDLADSVEGLDRGLEGSDCTEFNEFTYMLLPEKELKASVSLVMEASDSMMVGGEKRIISIQGFYPLLTLLLR